MSSEDIVLGSAISFARANKATGAITNEYIAEVQRELEAIGPRLNGRRQAAMAALIVLDKLDLMPKDDPRGIRSLGLYGEHEFARFIASNWLAIAKGFGGDAAALKRLGIEQDNFFSVFENHLMLRKKFTISRSVWSTLSETMEPPRGPYDSRNGPVLVQVSCEISA